MSALKLDISTDKTAKNISKGGFYEYIHYYIIYPVTAGKMYGKLIEL